ncbi:MAG: hypothetical protein DWP92_09050 [Armatimonadetes bacterium]|nr:MAG: hypothetical protein DWP92_09050 [Armatimonadota bacterium]
MDKASNSSEQTLTHIETDINCAICLEDARQALVAVSDVEEVKVDSAAGSFAVVHNAEPDRLVEAVTRLGYRTVTAPTGELGMGPVTVESVASCTHQPDSSAEPKAP